jgi:hypothetical protein
MQLRNHRKPCSALYSIRRDQDGITFTCSECTYSILIHKSKAGTPSPRTFAAGVLRQHAEKEHKGRFTPISAVSAMTPVEINQQK